jgi:hypothetical protein
MGGILVSCLLQHPFFAQLIGATILPLESLGNILVDVSSLFEAGVH